MYLYVARHAAAAIAGPYADADRPLTPEGEAQAAWLGGVLARLDVPPEIVLSSPALRCRDTATLAARALRLHANAVRADDGLAGDRGVAGMLDAIAGPGADAAVLLVGHAPDVEALASALLGGTTHVRLRFRYACCAGLQLDAVPPAQPAILHWFIGPEMAIGAPSEA
jgi:phosphohistidine phosphatase